MTCEHYEDFKIHALEYETALNDETISDDEVEVMRHALYNCATAVPGLAFGFAEDGSLYYEYNP